MLDLVIEQRRRDLGGFEVGRVLPVAQRRAVGPFVFFDHMGPVSWPSGLARDVDVRPHPHIGLATVTYLFAGEIMHRDSVGSEQPIRPREVVSSSRERIEQAKADWRAGRIKLPDFDDGDPIALPDQPPPAASIAP